MEGPVGHHLGDLLAVVELADDPRDEPVREKGPQRLLAETDVVPVEELAELVAAGLAVDPAEEALRHARGLYDVEALQHGGLVRHQLPQEQLGLCDVELPHRRARLGHVLEHVWQATARSYKYMRVCTGRSLAAPADSGAFLAGSGSTGKCTQQQNWYQAQTSHSLTRTLSGTQQQQSAHSSTPMLKLIRQFSLTHRQQRWSQPAWK